jgi:AraC-like DNA-binding protein
MSARARAVTLANYAVVARHVGLNPHAMLSRAGLNPASLDDPENWIPAIPVLNLLEDSAARSDRDDFGVLLGECRSFASLGPVSLLLYHENTVRGVISSMIEYRQLINELLQLSLQDDGETAVLEWNLTPGLRSSQGINLLATVAYRVLTGSGCSFEPDCIHFRQRKPSHLFTFGRVFGCALEFESSFDGISFGSASLNRTNDFADHDLTIHARRLLNLLPNIRPDDSVAVRTRSIIPMMITKGQADIENVARSMGLSVRSLQRRLADERQSFSGILNETRKELARRYLADSNQSITSVAQLTGYSSASSFARWFVLEFGTSPGAWRNIIRKRNVRHLRPAAA